MSSGTSVDADALFTYFRIHLYGGQPSVFTDAEHRSRERTARSSCRPIRKQGCAGDDPNKVSQEQTKRKLATHVFRQVHVHVGNGGVGSLCAVLIMSTNAAVSFRIALGFSVAWYIPSSLL
jgi:hypothetical protein